MVTKLMSSSVFPPSDFPEYTYVPRDELHHERLLREWLRSSTQIASISGPSKAGKTVLVQRVVGKDKLVTVSGASVRSADQLWERVLDWWGEPHAMMTSTVETSTDTDTREHAGTIGLSGTGASHRSAHANAAAAAETLQVTANRRGLPQVVQELGGGPYTLLLDDFHYIPLAVQADVAQQLKDAASRGVRICVANVPYKADNVVRALPELHGRVLAIDLDYWSKRDLLEIPRLGLPLLGLDVDRVSLEMFASEAAGSPQLMQAICLWMCNHLGCRDTIEPPRSIVLDELARKEILFLTSHLTDFRSLVRALIGGPRVKPGDRRTYVHKDGRSGDVYLTLMRALAQGTPRLMFQRNDVAVRLEQLCDGPPPDSASVVRACAIFGQIAQNFAPPTGPALEWDEQAQCLIISDPYLLFYLRWSVILEREADALV